MDKLKFETKSGVERNIGKIAELFPEVITESRDKDGNLVKSVNFDTLKSLFASTVEGRAESYDFTWVGKREAMIEAGTPIRKTLRPIKADSKDWDTTQNLYIEGDNLDVLKLLTDSYLGKVKMIYIDPPYNTGNDFVYKDNFTMSQDDYEEGTERVDDDGNVNFKENLATNPRFHSDWCSMMYPRLKVARNLLSDDGVIFISIDDHEQANIKKICDEIFGTGNFVAQIIREAIRGGSQSADIRKVHDYVLCYCKNRELTEFSGFEKDEVVLDLIDEKGKYAKGRELNKWGAGSRREDAPGMWFSIIGPNGVKVFPIRNDGSEGRWRLGKENMHKKVAEGDVIFEKRENGTYIAYEKIRGSKGGVKQLTTLFIEKYVNSRGTEAIKSLFKIERSLFDYAKPLELIHDLAILCDCRNEDIILDFFSGSATTAHAVMQLNAEDGGNRKFIMVQLPEKTTEDSEAYKAGYKNICEIGKERIRRAGQKIADENRMTAPDLDTGFRVFRLDESNFKDVHFSAGQVTQMSSFDTLAENLKEDRTAEDLLYSCILEWGLPLTLTHTEETIEGKKVYVVNGGDLIACFESELPESVIKAIAARKPLNALFRESCFKDSPAKINNEEIFKLISPSTKVKVL